MGHLHCILFVGCPEEIRLSTTLIAVLQNFQDGMTAKVVVGGHESDPFPVNVVVKQGFVLAPVIFNLFLVVITLAFRYAISAEAGVSIDYSLDRSLFNLRRLETKTKTTTEYCVPKRCHQTHGGNFVKSQPIFKILSPLEREGNFH